MSKQSSVSAGDLEDDEDLDDEATSADPSKKKKKRGHTPFIIKIFKFNAPEWHWIVLGVAGSLVYGAIQPIFALFFAQIYGLFAEPNLEEQKRLTSIYAAIIFLTGLAGGIAILLTSIGFAKSGEALTKRMRILTFSAMLRQEMGYFDHESNSVGALVTRLSSDAAALKVTVLQFAFSMVIS
jgi:ABC-type multidrug transport system fused ATPase/permease subunit